MLPPPLAAGGLHRLLRVHMWDLVPVAVAATTIAQRAGRSPSMPATAAALPITSAATTTAAALVTFTTAFAKPLAVPVAAITVSAAGSTHIPSLLPDDNR